MDMYLQFFIFLFGFTAGLAFGSLVLLTLMDRKKGWDNDEEEELLEEEFPEEEFPEDVKQDKGGLLKQRLTDKEDSWTDFNCAADEIDESDYIKASRKRQDKAYCYAGRKEV